MKTLTTLLLLITLGYGVSSGQSTVGMHTLKIAEPGVTARLVSIPFLRVPLALGRLDGIEVAATSTTFPILLDQQAAFSDLEVELTYILRITDGPEAGAWFIIDAASDDGQQVSIREDGLAGSVASLHGNESFAVHRLFSLSELFPATNSTFPSAPIDLAAMQVHFYDGNRFSKCWLSDGTLTEHVGWTIAEDGLLKDAAELSILPGTSFLVVYPNASEEESIQINGVVPYAGLTVPVYPGYNYVSVNYSQLLEGDLAQPADYLGALGLLQSGFTGGTDAEASDLILALDDDDGTFVEGYYYDIVTNSFKQASSGAVAITLNEVGPGRGFVIFNRGESYLWKFNQ
ncbi:hypothetical protein ACWPKO_01255 [Coraliomargarita sp. W4R53]